MLVGYDVPGTRVLQRRHQLPDAHRVPVLVVVAGSKNWAIPVVHVIESMRLPRVEAITGAPSFLLGLTVIRGESVPVVQLGSLFGDVGKATADDSSP